MSVRIAIFSFINKLLGLVRLKPLTLGEKCRLQFGAAILVVLTIALLIPYFWIGKLTEKISLDSGRGVANTIFERHFQVELPPEKELLPLLESGDKRQAENRAVKWIRLDTEKKLEGKTLSAYQKEIIKQLERNKCADVCRGMADGCDIIHDDNGSDAAHDCARAIEALS